MNDKRNKLLEVAVELFYSKGGRAVGINEILKVSGIAKKTLYHHFSSKEDLIIATLEVRDERFCFWFEELLTGSQSNEELVERMFRGLSKWFNGEVEQLDSFRGCFFINACSESRGSEDEISLFCKEHKIKVRDIILRHMPDPNEELADYLCLLKEGAVVSAYVSQDDQAAEKAMSAAMGVIGKRLQVEDR